MKKRSLFTLLGWFIFLILPLQSQVLDQNIKSGLNSIKPMDTYNYVKQMCSPEFAGRFTGHEGYTKAAQWAAQKFKGWGLKPMNKKDGYLQPFPAPYSIIKNAEMILLLNKGGEKSEVKLEIGPDFLPLLYSDNGA